MRGSFKRLLALMLSLVLLFSAGAMPQSVVHAEADGFAPMASSLLAEDLFVDDFEDGNADGWSGSGYAVVTEGGTKTLKYTYTSGSSTTKYVAAGDSAWTSYSVEARLRNGNEDNATGLHARYANANNFYGLRLDLKNDVVYLLRVVNGSSNVLDSAPMTLSVNTFYKLRLDVDGSSLTGYVDDVQVIAASDTSLASGKIALGGYSKSNYSIDDVRVTALRVPSSMTVEPQNAVILQQETRQLSANVYDQGNQIISGLPLSWSSDNPSIATVDGNGLVQGVAAGSTVIRAGYGSLEANAVITVQGTIGDPPYVADKTLAPIVVNGVLDESVWSVDRSINKLVVGTSGNTAEFGALWDEKYLYVGAKVMDSQLFNDSTGNYDDDSVEVFIDADHNHGAVYDLKDWQFSKGYGDSGLWEKLSETAGVKHGWSAIAGGYAVELAIPWVNLGLVAEPGLDIGFDIAVNDDDNGGVRDGQLVWTGIANNYQNTASFGDLILSAAEVGTPVTPPAPVQADRYVTPLGAGAKNGTSWSNAMQGDKAGGLQAAWAETGPTSTLYVGSGSYTVPQTLNMTSGGLDVLNMKKLVGVNTGGGLPEFTGDFQLTNQVNRSFINVPIGVSYWTVQDIVIRNYYNGIYANGQHEGIRILNVSVHDMSDGIYLWGRATRSNPDAGSHDIVIKDGEYTNFTKSAVRFRNGNYLASVINVTADAGGQANWAPGNFPMGFRIGNSPEQSYIFDHDIVFQDVVSKNSWHENGTDYWNGDGFTAERQAYNITYLRSKAFGSTDGGWDDKSIDPVLIGTVAFDNKRNYRFWGNPTLIQAVGGYSFKRGGSGDAPGLWVGSGTGKADVYYSTFFNNQHSEIALESSSNEVNLYNSIVGKTNGTYLYALNGGQLTATDTEQYIQGVQGTNPQLVNGANDEWDGEGDDFNSLVYGNTKGYFQPGQSLTPYTVQISVNSLTLGLYEDEGISAQVYDENNNPVADPEKLVWYVDDGFTSRLLQSRGQNAVVQGLNAGVTDIVAVYKGAEARISVTVTP
ncbi:sugar-binding protein [Paenibacillus sp. PAMC21692]|uniref:sugar-binding protein n=1 Tax=Paenibacillus sp. PAMC21692 TaxID=2762320 RepID=UPI00164EBC85|nr:sugar-binding protein [Paenibacillus sp. PAMC21692]QNK56998.1 Ig-like domain-containing protein [Paenibacillus sp. PAMC21692]